MIYSMGVSVDSFIADREGAFGWTVPNEEQLRFHIAQIHELGGYLCGRICRHLVRYPEGRLQPHARQRSGQRPACRGLGGREAAAALDATDQPVSIGGAGLAAGAIELGLVDELRMFGNPVLVGGGTPFLPPVTEAVPLDLVETRTFGARVIYERYRRARGESD